MKHFHAILATEMTLILVAILWAIVEISKTYPVVLIIFHLLLTFFVLTIFVVAYTQALKAGDKK